MVLKNFLRRSRDKQTKFMGEIRPYCPTPVAHELNTEECEAFGEYDNSMVLTLQEYKTQLWVADIQLESERTRADEMLRRLHSRKEVHKELSFNLRREKEWSDQLAHLLQRERDDYAALSQRLEMERAVYAQQNGALQESLEALRLKLEALEEKDRCSEGRSIEGTELVAVNKFGMERIAVENMQLREELNAVNGSLKLYRESNERLATMKDRLLEQLKEQKRELEAAKAGHQRRGRALPQRELSPRLLSGTSAPGTDWANDLYPPLPPIDSPTHEASISLPRTSSSPSRSPSSSVTSSPISSHGSLLGDAQHPSPVSEIEEEFPCFNEAPEDEFDVKDWSAGMTKLAVDSAAPVAGKNFQTQQPARRRWI